MSSHSSDFSSSNAALQERLLDLAGEGFLVLTETERMSHQVLHRGRLRRIASGAKGWETPPVQTFNQWMERFWDQLWPDSWPASLLDRWRLLKDCVEDTGTPEEIDPDASLIALLDESFEHCLRYGIDPGAGDPATPAPAGLAEWRRQVWRAFSRELSQRGMFHPAELAQRIVTALQQGQGTAPRRLAAAGFEFAGFWEDKLLSELRARSELVRFQLPAGTSEPRAIIYADPEQELYGLFESLTAAAANTPLHQIALVLLDSESYLPLVSKHLGDLFGPPLSGDLAAYNLLPDRTLDRQPLFAAAFLPLSFRVQGEWRADLLGLLRSPYYEELAKWSRKLTQWDRTWRELGIESGFKALFSAIPHRSSEPPPEFAENLRKLLFPFAGSKPRLCSEWLADVREFWRQMGFPITANERDQISWTSLQALMASIEELFGNSRLSGSELWELLRMAGSKVKVQRSGSEEAGIQVLGALEARGLAFIKMFVPGFMSASMPQPVRHLPFLTPAERKQVLGGSLESQYAFASHLFGNLRAATSDLVLTRPAMDPTGEMNLPSPFWPEEREQEAEPVIPWRQDIPALHRARWVQECILGISAVSGASGEAAFPVFPDAAGFTLAGVDVSSPLAISTLEAALLCPTKFFFRHVLALEELPEPEGGLTPLERGKTMHDILAAFGKKVIATRKTRSADFEELKSMLEATVRELLEPVLPEAVWRVEARRLIGDSHNPGLLVEWLKEEWKRFQEGWSWEVVESGFRSLSVGGCPVLLSGRLDRVDSHPGHGLLCWDYKTGRAPGKKAVKEDLVSPQLPAYLLAIRKGLVEGADTGTAHSGAGYIELGSAGKLRHLLMLGPEEDHDALLSDWENKVCETLESICRGNITPLWLSDQAPCEDDGCPYRCLCGAP